MQIRFVNAKWLKVGIMKNNINSPVFVTGVKRSGASIIARIIQSCGAFTGEVSEMCENKELHHLVDSFYSQIHIPANGQYPMPKLDEILIPANWQSEVLDTIMGQGYKNQLWMFKDSRLGQMWPIWNYAFPNARWIIVRRRSADIINSCMKTAYMNAFRNPIIQHEVGVSNEHDGWLYWIHEHEKRFVEMIEAGLNCKVIWPERMVYGDYTQIYEMIEWLSLEINPNIKYVNYWIDTLFNKSKN